MKAALLSAILFSSVGPLVEAADPPATAPAKPSATSPSTRPASGPAIKAGEKPWVDVASVERGRKWRVTLALKEGAGEPEIKDTMVLASAERGQAAIWSPHFAALGFGPGLLTSSGGFPGGWAYSATSDGKELGQLVWSFATLASPAGNEHAQVRVTWERADGTKSVYGGKGELGQVGTTAESVAASHLLRVFGADSGVKMRVVEDPDPTLRTVAAFMSFEYVVGEGENQKQGVVRLLNKHDFWKLANKQPENSDTPPASK